jgi:amidase
MRNDTNETAWLTMSACIAPRTADSAGAMNTETVDSRVIASTFAIMPTVCHLGDILFCDATDQLKALLGRQISARELLQISVARTDQLGRRLNAVVSHDLDRAYAEARTIDECRANDQKLGRLAGLPMTVKDTLDVEGLPGSAGLASMLDRRARDAAVVSRIRSQGAILWGKTNTPIRAGDWQTYNPLHGMTNNPWDVKLTPGGSSGGSAAA